MKFINIIFLFLNIIDNIKSLYLTNYQLNLINNLIQNDKINVIERNKINMILFKAYENFAIKKSLEFRSKHKFKCKDIKNDELFFSSKIGLFKSIKKYNGKHSLANYSTMYINSELFKLLTDKYSLSGVPKKERTKNKSNSSINELYNYKKLLNPEFASSYENWQSDSLFVSNEDIVNKIMCKNEYNDKLISLISKLTPSMKRILYLKYFTNNNSNKCMSNKDISLLMSCSEEAIRKQLIKIKNIANKI
jgi:RNA polymerase sigma factor (sigma-70 family)